MGNRLCLKWSLDNISTGLAATDQESLGLVPEVDTAETDTLSATYDLLSSVVLAFKSYLARVVQTTWRCLLEAK